MIFETSMGIVAAAVLGAIVGSFINAAEYRLARGEHVGRGVNGEWERSRCPYCQTTLTMVDLVPVLSYVWLGGQCRSCRRRIAWQYPAVELVTAVLFGVAVWRFDWSTETVVVCAAMGVLVFLFLYDLKYYELPDHVTLPAIVLALLAGVLTDRLTPMSMVVGGLVGGFFFLLQYLVSRGVWVGAGDVRFGVLLGVLLGWERTVAALVIAYLLGSVVAVALLATKRLTMKSMVPFGTFLSVATVVCLLYGYELIDWYWRLFL